MATCANCVADAPYAYKINDELTINYCNTHLPKFLNAQKNAGLLKPEAPKVEAAAPTKTSKKKEEVVVEEAPVEEAPVDDATN